MKYIVEGNIDFYNELYKSLEDKQIETKDELPVCLITNEPLTEHYFKMMCGHTFNYVPLYYDILNHKKKFNSMELSSGHLKINEIRCPYCRNKQPGVLPYYEVFELEKVTGVNVISELKIMKNDEQQFCGYLTENSFFNPELSENEMMNQKFIKCFNYGTKIVGPTNYGDEKCYCYNHKKLIISKYKKEAKEKEKQVKEILKQKEKEDKKIIKEQQNKKQKCSKVNDTKSKNNMINKIEELNLDIQEENQVLTNIDTGCMVILKSGPNKGNKCEQKVFENGICKRHFHVQTIKNNI
jgi:hypothetical protein